MTFKIPRVHTQDRLINQLQQNICPLIEGQFQQLSGQFVCTLTGVAETTQGAAIWQRAVLGGPITLFLPELLGTSNTTRAAVTGLPPELWPAINQICPFITYDNGVAGTGFIQVTNAGALNLAPSPVTLSFTASGIKGITNGQFTYMTVG